MRILRLMAVLGLAPFSAAAHAVLEHSAPAQGGSAPAGPIAIELQYNSRIDAARSRLELEGPDRKRSALPILPSPRPDALLARTQLTPGSYVIRWQVLSVDGHITRGSVPFTVTGR
jgi:copper resistance protein C